MTERKLIPTTTLHFYEPDLTTVLELPYISNGIKAGFPSPALDFMGEKIDMNKELIKHPQETFYVRVDGHSMKDSGIEHEDILVVDRSLSLPPVDGKIYVCQIDGEFTIKTVRIVKEKRRIKEIWLVPANDDFQPVQVTEDNEFMIWGRVIRIIKSI